MIIKFPEHYLGTGDIGKIHMDFAYNLLQEIDNVTLEAYNNKEPEWPIFKIGNLKIMFDYQDFKELHSNYKNADIILKTQYTDNLIKYKNVYPWSQVSFMDWKKYEQYNTEIKYTANSNIIINAQKPYGNAKQRRIRVSSILKEKYNNNVIISPSYTQDDFFKLVNNCLVYVHVSGYSNNMIDRSHVQMFGLGCCVITTEIPNIFPNKKKPIPGVHYIKCKNDYSDVIEIIEWCKKNRNECVKIGNNAKILFEESLTPNSIGVHIKKILKEWNQ